jgi:hypothetical protein
MVGAYGGIKDTDINSTLYVPLEFWFCRNIGLALPLIALQYHEVKIKIEFENMNNCLYKVHTDNTTIAPTTAKTLSNVNLWVDYIFLDTDERRKFAQLTHEYLIEQLQFTGGESISADTPTRVKLNFNHPCKELVWVGKYATNDNVNMWYNYTMNQNNRAFGGGNYVYNSPKQTLDRNIHDFTLNVDNTNFDTKIVYNVEPGFNNTAVNPFSKCLLQLNGNDRFAERDGTYFNYVQPYQHHTNIPANCGINVYSFALKPEDHQPSGTLNMSRIDTAVLSVVNNSTANGSIHIYAVNYNVLRILSGMGGLAYYN